MGSPRRRPPLSVALLGGDDRKHIQNALERLGGQLSAGDNAVVVAPGWAVESTASWRESTAYHGGLRKPIATPRLCELVLVLDERVLFEDGLVDSLVEAIEAPSVGAVGALSNVADGDELFLGPPYFPTDHSGRRAFTRRWTRQHAGTLRYAERLGGPAVLLGRAQLEAVGGLKALARGEGLAAALKAVRDDGLRLAVAESAYVHHVGGAPRQRRAAGMPFVSACLIVRDEEHQLEGCLESAKQLADEIIVYDTGSKDGTVDLARRLGARVEEGYWDDDFGRARNAALARCRGQWILWLDADEIFVCDPVPLRSTLEMLSSDIEALLVLIDNLQGTDAGTAMTHPAARLFRRGPCHWEGNLHEQVVRRTGGTPSGLKLIQGPRILHRGYLQATIASRGKGARNLRSAFGDLASDAGLDLGMRLLSLGRSYLLTGRLEEGIELSRRALEVAEVPATRRLALRAIGDACLGVGRAEEALAAANQLRAFTRVAVLADIIEGRARLALGQHEAALRAFGRVGEVIDDDGFEYRPSLVAGERATCFSALGRPGEAADILLATLRRSGGLDVHLGQLVEALESAGREPTEIYDAFGKDRLLAFVPQLLQLDAPAADRVLEAWHGRDPSCLPVLATAAKVASRLDISRQLQWSFRLRAAGLRSACPLLAAALDRELPARDRALAAAVAWVSFADRRGLMTFGATAAQVEVTARQQLRAELELVAPALLEAFDMLVPPQFARTHPQGSSGRRTVLVLARNASNLRPAAIALSFAGAGYEVILAHPQPAKSSEELLGHAGISVRGWFEPSPGDWEGACSTLVARSYAAQQIDAVVLTAGTAKLAGRISQLLPGAALLEDVRRAPLPAAGTAELLGIFEPLARDRRVGLCIVSDLREASDEDEAELRSVLDTLGELVPGEALAHLGNDPRGLAKRFAPELVAVGPVADPSPWVRVAAGLVVAGVEDQAEWLELARACGTPSVVLRADSDVTLALKRLVEQIETGVAAPLPEAPTPIVPANDKAGGIRSWSSPSPHVARSHRAGLPLRLAIAPAAAGTDLAGRTDAMAALAATPPLPGLVELVSDVEDADLVLCADWPPARAAGALQGVIALPEVRFGGLPAEWIGSLRGLADECWVPSTLARAALLESGIDSDHITVVPPGIDLARFSPEGERFPLRTRRPMKILFNGPITESAGIDALLEAWVAFVGRADACLVINPRATPGHVAADAGLERAVQKIAADAGERIELLTSLEPRCRADLYRACDVLVHPYRDDPSGRVVAEAIACGLPVIVVEGTAAAALVDENVAWTVASRRRGNVAPPSGWTPTSASFFWHEPTRAALAAALDACISNVAVRQAKANAARQFAAERLDLQAAARVIAGRLEHLLAPTESTARREQP